MEEIERSWCAVGDEGAAAWEEMRKRRSIGANELERGIERTFQDRVYDLEGGELAAQGITLRVRSWEGGGSLTVKGRTRRDVDGTLTRLECEADCTSTAAPIALEQIHAFGGPCLGASRAADTVGLDPGEAWSAGAFLASFGLQATHNRITRRLARRVLGTDGGALAELAVDRVKFPLADRPVIHLELELELLPGADRSAFDAAAAGIDRLGSLRPWPHSKTALGRALESLAASGALGALLNQDGRLTREGYDRLEAELG